MRKDQRYLLLIDTLAKARKRLNLPQKTLAGRLHKPQSYVSKYESGERRLDVVEFLIICEALAIKPYVILNKLKKIPLF
jgi:transcriptional regulator with XRE-family HTH domain